MTTDFREKLLLTLLDKLLLASVLILAGYWLNGRLEGFKSNLEDQRVVAEERRTFMSKQLSEFYWPLYLRLQKDTDAWIVAPDAKGGLGSALDDEVLRPNRKAITKLIEENLYLAHADAQLLEKLQRLLRHIAVSEALRAQGLKEDPCRVKKDYCWPDDVLPAVREATLELQKRYDDTTK
jgi:hypothetical protein